MSKTSLELKLGIEENLCRILGRFPQIATRHNYYLAVAYTVRDWMLDRWVKTASTYLQEESRTVIYLSAEFLIGPQLGKNLISLGILEDARLAVAELGQELDDLLDQEEEPGLGNG